MSNPDPHHGDPVDHAHGRRHLPRPSAKTPPSPCRPSCGLPACRRRTLERRRGAHLRARPTTTTSRHRAHRVRLDPRHRSYIYFQPGQPTSAPPSRRSRRCRGPSCASLRRALRRPTSSVQPSNVPCRIFTSLRRLPRRISRLGSTSSASALHHPRPVGRRRRSAAGIAYQRSTSTRGAQLQGAVRRRRVSRAAVVERPPPPNRAQIGSASTTS